MDVLSYWHVIQRQRRIVLVGLVLTTVLAFLAAVRISPSGISYRSPATFSAKSTLLVTQQGFPWGRSALTEYVKARGTSENISVPKFADPTRMQYLASLYAQFATSDAVWYRVLPLDGPDSDSFTSTALKASDGTTLPLIEITGESTSEKRAIEIARGASRALRRYVLANQNANDVPEATRIALPVVVGAQQAEVLRGPRRTPAIMFFLLGVVATILTAFTVDNMRRRPVGVAHATDAPAPGDGRPELVPAEPAVPEEARRVPAAAVAAESRPRKTFRLEPVAPAVPEEARDEQRAAPATQIHQREPDTGETGVPAVAAEVGARTATRAARAWSPERVRVDAGEPVAAEGSYAEAAAPAPRNGATELGEVEAAAPAANEGREAPSAAPAQERAPELVSVETTESASAVSRRAARAPRDARGRFVPTRRASHE